MPVLGPATTPPPQPDFDRFSGALLGLAVGDALAAQTEQSHSDETAPALERPVGGTFNLQPGEWTAPTAMAMCLAESLLARQGWVADDLLDRLRQYYRAGYWACRDHCFGIDGSVRFAVEHFEENGKSSSRSESHKAAPDSAAIARLAPVALFFASTPKTALQVAGESSLVTDPSQASREACALLAAVLLVATQGTAKDSICTTALARLQEHWPTPLLPQTEQIAHGGQLETPGLQFNREHPAPATLAAALESIRSTGSFRAALLRTVNQTNETAATIAVCGQIAGAHYGVSGIPEEWLERLAWRKAIEKIATHLSTSSMRRHQTPVQSHHRWQFS